MSTIAAISTAPGNAGIGIIRLSGDDCFKILQKIFKPKNKGEIKGYTIKYGNIVKSENDEIIDEVLVSYFVAPKSYTKENMCEINSHGGIVVENQILEECLKNGAVLAEPGEFTKRAFMNGRIDLSQAEAVIDIINSKTEKEMMVAQRHLEGSLSKKIKDIQGEILNLMADIEASIDYPEYDIEETTNKKINDTLNSVEEKLLKLKNSFENGKILKEGIKIDEILYSPLMRAADTAKHISEVTGIPAREELRLKEQNFGKYESTPRNGEEFKRAKQDFVCRYEGGESMLQLCQRIYNLLDDIKKEDKVYLLVAHNGISRAIESYVRDMSNEEFAGFGIKNCELRKYEF